MTMKKKKENLFCGEDFHSINAVYWILSHWSQCQPSHSKEWSPFITHIRINALLQAWNKGERNVNVNHHLWSLLQDYFISRMNDGFIRKK